MTTSAQERQQEALADRLALRTTRKLYPWRPEHRLFGFDDAFAVAREAAWMALGTYKPSAGPLGAWIVLKTSKAIKEALRDRRLCADVSRAGVPMLECVSLDASVERADGSHVSIEELVGAAEHGYARIEAAAFCEHLQRTLPAREWEVLRARFFDGLSLRQISGPMGISDSRAFQLSAQGARRAREALNG